MNTPLITWSLIVGLFIIVLIVHLLKETSNATKKRKKIVTFMTEREEFFIPGDPNPRKVDEYDCEDL